MPIIQDNVNQSEATEPHNSCTELSQIIHDDHSYGLSLFTLLVYTTG